MYSNSSDLSLLLPSLGRKVSGSNSTGSSSTNVNNSRVTFGPVDCHVIDPIPSQCRSRVYYKGSELNKLQKLEMIAARSAMANSATDDIESSTMTWRGMEDLRDGTDAAKKSKAHTSTIVEEWKKQKQAGCTDAHQKLCQVSKASSKQDKSIALKKGQKDAEAAGQEVAKKGPSSRAFGMIQKSFLSLSSVQAKLTPAAC